MELRAYDYFIILSKGYKKYRKANKSIYAVLKIMITHPFLDDTYPIHWSKLTPEFIAPDIEYALTLAEENLEKIRTLKECDISYETTFLALENATEALNIGWGRVNHLDSVLNNDSQREALNKMLPKVSAFYSSISLDSAIWSKLKAFATSSKVKELAPIYQRFIKLTCNEFIQSGADLPEDKKKQIAEVSSKLSELTQKFSENTLDSTNAWELIVDNEAQLRGIPEMFLEGARQNALSKGLGSEEAPQWRFTLQQPSFYPVLQHAEEEALRKNIWEGLNTVGFSGEWDNSKLIWEILSLRQQKAELLGKANFADLVLEERMAKTGDTAINFINNLHHKVLPSFLKEHQELIDFKSKKTNSSTENAHINPWEVAFWEEQMRHELYDFDEQELRPYFNVEQVMDGMFTIFSKLFNITIKQCESKFGTDGDGIEVWHSECSYYELYDTASNAHLGSFYADWHPRESKRGGAWMNSLKTGGPIGKNGEHLPHVGLIIGNMTKPVGDKPALLDHREVETIFHEFGHLLHQLLSTAPIKSLSGTNVPWDFVELPSQILENWCWDRESLDLFARHYETGETIPEGLFQKMLAAKNFRSASGFMRQLSLGKIDLEIHYNMKKYQGKNLDKMDEEILEKYRVNSPIKSPTILRKFSHLFSSPVAYAAGYYSYKWAEVLDADAFTRFQKEGILNKATGMAFRKEILSQGDSRPVDESYEAFMGRSPELTPLLKRSNIK